ncbi:MAG TPA: bifunctional 4-hydroxy-2-oxoglutarate aldolase/2-dehydro-3-deoxy-phosphogluconate aldolase [Parapedobacter sp.]|uniref:bifunctional 4-hydroxy-2-oxoglutarate aldolase/2-dehydro-3-deoxy-phosphogluconate aldolase n=1 Tax=Parapedobacter sp. TaxID=1958893 RepID=UPI002C623A17|nr:bifunctional 4-hydroxy-2-oxoglutarate aldolase/2-dehydro-3-deoxy-phosphogluconate aldolase [Parapedobacter sp.]HWK57967.1 bifunctional 4-hydroxy-2-oxoglutarate aldolase/2-dehydro-3-deoxy-phosphogluconate aldolase [Parapedobacter sp.]
MRSTLAEIKEHRLVAIVRGLQPQDVLPVAEALYAGGIRILEVTMNSVEPLTAIQTVSNALGNQMVIGAGTVLDAAMAEAAVSAGARFVLSPVVVVDLIKVIKALGAVAIPGAYTPTEIFIAYQNGADIVKVFPATSPAYIKDIAGPLPQIPLLPTGGITPENVRDYKQAGAMGFGVGSALVDTKQPVTPHYLEQITEKARRFVAALAD